MYAKKTPVAITRLLPGRYRIKVHSPGFQTWQQELSVQAEEVTRVERVLLVPEKPNVFFPTPFSFYRIIVSNEGKFLFLMSREKEELRLHAFDLKKKRSFPVLTQKVASRKIVELASSTDDRRLLVCFKEDLKSDCLVASLARSSVPISLASFLDHPVTNVRLNPRDSKEIFYLSGNELCQLNLDDQTKKIGLLKDVRSFEVVRDKIYYFTRDFHLFSSNLDGKESVDLLPERGFRRLLFGEEEKNRYQMFFTEKSNAFWLRQDGTLLMNRLPYFSD